MALESTLVQAEMIEAMEFPEMADRHQVSGVPHTVINLGAGNVIGAVPEFYLLAEIKQALGLVGAPKAQGGGPASELDHPDRANQAKQKPSS